MSRVLVIDDDPMILKAVSRELRAAGWEVRVATVEPIGGSEWAGIDVLLTDWEPGGEDALAVATYGNVPAVVMTGNDALVLPGVTIVRKPWQPGELDAALRAAINKENRSC